MLIFTDGCGLGCLSGTQRNFGEVEYIHSLTERPLYAPAQSTEAKSFAFEETVTDDWSRGDNWSRREQDDVNVNEYGK